MNESKSANGPEIASTASNEPVRVGISGLGRSGWSIHANTLAQIGEQFRVTAVCDPDNQPPGGGDRPLRLPGLLHDR